MNTTESSPRPPWRARATRVAKLRGTARGSVTALAFRLLVAVAGVVVVPTGFATPSNDKVHGPQDDRSLDGLSSEKWREGEYEVPSLPDESEMLELDPVIGARGYEYRIHLDSITAGDDGVLRYVIAVRSSTGQANILFEGVHCRERAYRTYGYGTSRGEFRPLGSARWTPLNRSVVRGPLSYRRELARSFLCEPDGGNSSVERVRGRLSGKIKSPWFGTPRVADVLNN